MIKPQTTPRFIPDSSFQFRRSTIARKASEISVSKNPLEETVNSQTTQMVKELQMDEKFAMMEEIKETVETETSYIES